MPQRNRPIPPPNLTREKLDKIERPVIVEAWMCRRDCPAADFRAIIPDLGTPAENVLDLYNAIKRHISTEKKEMNAVFLMPRKKYRAIEQSASDPTPLDFARSATACFAPGGKLFYCGEFPPNGKPVRWLTATGEWSFLFRHAAGFTEEQKNNQTLPKYSAFFSFFELSKVVKSWGMRGNRQFLYDLARGSKCEQIEDEVK